MARLLGRRRVWGPLLLALVAGTMWMYRQAYHAMDLADPDRARSHGRPIPVRTAPATEEEFEQVIGATALTSPSREAMIRPSSPSRGQNTTDVILGAVHVHEGDYVHEGQLLFEVVDEVRLQDVRRAQAALTAAQAQLNQVRKTLTFTQRGRELELASSKANLEYRTEDRENRERVFEAYKRMQKDRAASLFDYWESRSKFAQARFELTDAQHRLQRAKDAVEVGNLQDEADLARAKRDVELAQIDLEQAQLDLRWCKLKSPIDGFIEGKVDVVPGQVLAATTPLVRVVQLEALHVRLDFPQERMDEVSVGQEAEIVLDSFPKETFHGKVIRISPLVNPQLRVFPVVVEMANPGNLVKEGVSGFVRVRVKRKVIGAPVAAVIQHGGKAMVFRVVEGRARLFEVHTGHLLEHGIVEVRQGLAPGDEVVVYFSNFYRHWRELSSRECYLKDNDPVDTDWRRWTRRE
jgi:RND family efflux transporter MFP subunit